MSAILQSLGRTVAAGVVLLVIIIILAGAFTGHFISPDMGWSTFFMRWLHVLSGIMWIGLLWYFNFVQIPSMPKIPDEQKPAVSKVIAPTALFWFRWRLRLGRFWPAARLPSAAGRNLCRAAFPPPSFPPPSASICCFAR